MSHIFYGLGLDCSPCITWDHSKMCFVSEASVACLANPEVVRVFVGIVVGNVGTHFAGVDGSRRDFDCRNIDQFGKIGCNSWVVR